MIRRKEEIPVEMKNIRGGIGEAEAHKLLNAPEEMYGKGRLFNHMILAPGNSVGYHMHEGDNEVYYILAGSGEYNDNGEISTIKAGDVTICNDGESHGLLNTGTEPIELIALILYT